MNIQTISPYTCYTCVAKRAKDIWIQKDVCLLNVVDFLILVGPFECRCLREKKILFNSLVSHKICHFLCYSNQCVCIWYLFHSSLHPFDPDPDPDPHNPQNEHNFQYPHRFWQKKMKRKPSHQMNCYDGHGHTVKRASERWNEWVQALLIATRKQTAKNAKQIRKNLLLWMREKEIPKFKILQRDVFICFILCGIN